MGQLFKLSNLKWMLLLLIPTSMFVACSDDNYEEPNYSVLFPNASFEVELGKGDDPFTVSFSSTSNEGDTHEWNFGDGSIAAGANPTHTYLAEGTYQVTHKVSNERGTNVFSTQVVLEKEIPPSPLFGKWVMAPEAGSLGVGPNIGDYSWWSIDDAGVAARACYYDDEYVFNEDGTFQNVLGDETWVEGWQGGGDACGTPVAPHDGSNPATFEDKGGTVTIKGVGAYLGLAKVHNTAEDGKPVDDTITYNYTVSEDGNTVEFTIQGFNAGVPEAAWYFKMVKAGSVEPPAKTIVGTWKMASEAGALGVGPSPGDYSWWSIDEAGVTARACYFDDEYVFNADGSFQNVLGDETWVEGWQGGGDACGAPVAPHDGSNAATYTDNGGTVTIVGEGAYLGLAKVHNAGEDGAPVDNTITYNYTLSADGDTLEITIQGFNADVAEATWYYKMVRQ